MIWGNIYGKKKMNIKVSLPLLFMEKLGGGDCKMGKNYEISTVYPSPPLPHPFSKKETEEKKIKKIAKVIVSPTRLFVEKLREQVGGYLMCNTKCTCHYLFYFSKFLMMDRILMVRVTTCIPLL